MSGESLTIVTLSAEVTRLRAALGAIRDIHPDAVPQHMGDDYENGKAWGRYEAASVARRALDGGT